MDKKVKGEIIKSGNIVLSGFMGSGKTTVSRRLAAALDMQFVDMDLYIEKKTGMTVKEIFAEYGELHFRALETETVKELAQSNHFVIATGEMHTVREFCTLAFQNLGVELKWEGSGVDEKGIDAATGNVLVEVDPKYFRPCEVEQLLGDPTKAKTLLGWNPTKTTFPELVRIMVEHDMKFVKKLHLKAQLDKE